MVASELMCPRCGWRNEGTARMCGGCGQPLGGASPSPAAHPAPGPPHAIADSGYGYPHDAPTSFSPSAQAPNFPGYAGPAGNYAPAPPGQGSPVHWPGAGSPPGAAKAPPGRARGWRRALVVLFVLLLVLVCGGIGAWSSIVRPALHAAVDAQLRADITRAVQSVPHDLPPATYPINASLANADPAMQHPNDPKLKDVQVHFSDNGILVTYTYDGTDGSVRTTLLPHNGGIEARGTVVTGSLSVVETGDEMEAALNAGLAHWPRSDTVTDIHTDGDTLFMTISK